MCAFSVFMVMEYMEHDVKALMRSMKQPFRQSEVKCLLKQLLLATDAMYGPAFPCTFVQLAAWACLLLLLCCLTYLAHCLVCEQASTLDCAPVY